MKAERPSDTSKREPEFDLEREIDSLLQELQAGRAKLQDPDAKAIFEKCDRAHSASKQGFEQLNELAGPGPTDARELAEKNAEVDELHKSAIEAYNKQDDLTSFIVPFESRVARLLQRLPYETKWRHFPTLIKGLRFTSLDAWISPTANPDLDTLEIRLREMRNLLHLRNSSALSNARPPLSENLEKIIEIVGDDIFHRLRDAQIVATFGRKVREILKKPRMGDAALRASLRRIRCARGYPCSNVLRRTKVK